MRKINKFFSGLVLLFLASNLYADAGSTASDVCKVTEPLKPNQWQLIGIPCDAPTDANTVEAIFADDITGSYGTDWRLFSYNSTSNSFKEMSLQDVPVVGAGYVIITNSGQTLLDMPAGSQPVNQTNSTQCTSPGCFEAGISSNGVRQWQLLANPFPHSFQWSALRGKVATIDNTCGDSEGCTLTEMQTAGFVEDQGWYSDDTGNVRPLKGKEVSPWMGLWVAAMDTASSADAPTLLFPGAERNSKRAAPSSESGEGFFYLNFETSPLGEYEAADIEREWPGVHWPKPQGRVNVIEEGSNKGNRFIRVNYPRGGVGSSKGGGFWTVDFKDGFGTAYDELYVSYKVRFAKGFDPVKGGKLPGMMGGQGNRGGKRANGYDGWSARMMWRAEAAAVFYVYHADMPGIYGDDYKWDEVETRLFPAGEWVQIEHRIVMNSPENKNGILQGWYNGELAVDNHDMRYRKVDSFAIDGFYFNTFFGGSGADWAPTRNETIDFDDFIFSTVPITH
jgi:hypothetical protein